MHHLSSDREMVNTLHYSPNVCRDIQHYTQYFNKSKQNFYWQGRNKDPTSTESCDLSSWVWDLPPTTTTFTDQLLATLDISMF